MFYFQRDGTIDRDSPLCVRLDFKCSPSLTISCARDGESIELTKSDLPDEVDMAELGNTAKLQLSENPQLAVLVGQLISSATIVFDAFQRQVGVGFMHNEKSRLYIMNLGDELVILDELPDEFHTRTSF